MTLNCPEYLREAEKHLTKEEQRIPDLYESETKLPLLQAIYDEVITKQAVNLVEKPGTGCDYMFKNCLLD